MPPLTAVRIATTLRIILLTAISATAAACQPSTFAPLEATAGNPGNLTFLQYPVETRLAPGAALVVILHGCGQDAGDFAVDAGWTDAADEHGFALLLPQQAKRNNAMQCFNWFNPEDAGPDGDEVRSIMQAVDQMLSDRNLDPDRVFVTGLSAGAAMAGALLASNPDRFAGGGLVAGIAVGCATGLSSALRCMQSGDDSTSEALGERVLDRSEHQGGWPRVSIWHGDRDAVVRPENLDALMRQWTHVHGVPEQAASVRHIGPSEQRRYGEGKSPAVETWLVTGMGHAVPVDPGNCGRSGARTADVELCAVDHLLAFWGLAAGPVTGPAR